MSLKRINKAQARKLWNNGKEMQVVPCKARPDSMWFAGLLLSADDMYDELKDFDKMVDYFIVYNCCKELGKRPAFYIEE